jgi:hypothetical protein
MSKITPVQNTEESMQMRIFSTKSAEQNPNDIHKRNSKDLINRKHAEAKGHHSRSSTSKKETFLVEDKDDTGLLTKMKEFVIQWADSTTCMHSFEPVVILFSTSIQAYKSCFLFQKCTDFQSLNQKKNSCPK